MSGAATASAHKIIVSPVSKGASDAILAALAANPPAPALLASKLSSPKLKAAKLNPPVNTLTLSQPSTVPGSAAFHEVQTAAASIAAGLPIWHEPLTAGRSAVAALPPPLSAAPVALTALQAPCTAGAIRVIPGSAAAAAPAVSPALPLPSQLQLAAVVCSVIERAVVPLQQRIRAADAAASDRHANGPPSGTDPAVSSASAAAPPLMVPASDVLRVVGDILELVKCKMAMFSMPLAGVAALHGSTGLMVELRLLNSLVKILNSVSDASEQPSAATAAASGSGSQRATSPGAAATSAAAAHTVAPASTAASHLEAAESVAKAGRSAADILASLQAGAEETGGASVSAANMSATAASALLELASGVGGVTHGARRGSPNGLPSTQSVKAAGASNSARAKRAAQVPAAEAPAALHPVTSTPQSSLALQQLVTQPPAESGAVHPLAWLVLQLHQQQQQPTLQRPPPPAVAPPPVAVAGAGGSQRKRRRRFAFDAADVIAGAGVVAPPGGTGTSRPAAAFHSNARSSPAITEEEMERLAAFQLRQERLQRYRRKREARRSNPPVRYESRQEAANSRVRVRGRFVANALKAAGGGDGGDGRAPDGARAAGGGADTSVPMGSGDGSDEPGVMEVDDGQDDEQPVSDMDVRPPSDHAVAGGGPEQDNRQGREAEEEQAADEDESAAADGELQHAQLLLPQGS